MLLEEDSDDADLLGMDEEEEAEFLSDDTSEVLQLAALNWMDQIVKSKNFFSICLRAPDCEFRHMFRSALFACFYVC
jgi:hypothetical protein